MKNVSIVWKIQGLAAASVLIGASAVFYLVAVSRQINMQSQTIILTDNQQTAAARALQATFKTQVQYWKDILIRGSHPDLLASNRMGFEQQDALVKKQTTDLSAAITDPSIRDLLAQFSAAHSQLDGDYAAALMGFERSRGRDINSADVAVRGKDRPLSVLLDKLAEQLQKTAQAHLDQELGAAASREDIVTGVALAVLFMILLASIFLSRSIARPVKQTAALVEEIARSCDLTTRLPAETVDELGMLARGLNQLLESVQTLISSVAENASRLAAASEQISATANQQAQGSDVQKDQTQQVATAIQEISSTVAQVSEHASKAADASRGAAETARNGGKIVEETLAQMHQIAQSVGQTARKVEELGNRSDQIGEIIGVIDDIADQTNLLALNAAIEAARAGEQGRGFAVVADEVRKLAERTVKATKEISQMIKNIQVETKSAVAAMKTGTEQVEAGVQSTTAAGTVLEEIIRDSEQVGDMVTQIATASTQQASATEQVNVSVAKIAQITQEAALGAQQSAHAVQDLSNLALELQSALSKFKIHASNGGSGSGRLRVPRSNTTAIRSLRREPPREAEGRLLAS